ncbi:MAG: cysteine synthase A [Anaeroplasmataceae bacterium]
MIYNNVTELIGNTPILKANNIFEKLNLKANLFLKLELFNPTGSVKDRIAYNMINEALINNEINKDTVIVEPTSGNTGIGLASVCNALGLKLILVMPSSMSIERRNLMSIYGAELVLTDGSLGMKGAINKALEIVNENKNSFMPSQFENPNNPKAHIKTAQEILSDVSKVDILVAGVGTGGTITGVGNYLKDTNSNTKIVAVEPFNSSVLSGLNPGPHLIQGIGAGFVPNTLDTKVYDQIIRVSNEDAISTVTTLIKTEGIFCGISSGASLFAAIELAKLEENKGKNIVVILPDNGDRYLSMLVK